MPSWVDSLHGSRIFEFYEGPGTIWIGPTEAEFLLKYTEMFCLECLKRDCPCILSRKGLLRRKARNGLPEYFEASYVSAPYIP